jgi:hypothetical protein
MCQESRESSDQEFGSSGIDMEVIDVKVCSKKIKWSKVMRNHEGSGFCRIMTYLSNLCFA